jgi:hypothetical protein
MAVAAIIGSIAGSAAGSNSKQDTQQAGEYKETSNFLLDKLGAGGDPGGFLFNQIMQGRNREIAEKRYAEQLKMQRRAAGLQAEMASLQIDEDRRKKEWRRAFAYGR